MKLTALAAVAILALAGCSTGSGSAPLPQAPPASAPVTTEAPAAEAPVPAPAATTCDKAREAILTGTPADITAAMKALVVDKTAPATAREYARYYTVRDKTDKQMREMDVSLIQMSCTA